MNRSGILHLTTFLQGGAGRAITDLACAQRAAGHRVTVVTSRTGQGAFDNYPDYLHRLSSAGVTLHTCDSLFTRQRTLNMRVVKMLSRSVDVTAVDIIHAHAAVPVFVGEQFAAGARRRIGMIQTQHGWGINKTPQQAAFDIDMLGRVDRIVTTSRATGDQLAALGAPRKSMTVIPCGLPASDPGDPPAAKAVETRRRNGSRIVGCIGSVTANKNQRLLLEALRLLEDPAVSVAFLGEGSDALQEEARVLGVEDRVITCGYQPHASRWLPLFDLLVVPSRTEGQGLVVLEAFRARVPVVASDIPALAELIDNGRHGFLFKGGNSLALATAIRHTLSQTAAEREAMLVAAKTRFEADFTIDRMVRRHEELYQEVSAAKAAAARSRGARTRVAAGAV
jgi:glycosyltransferase involved in cell wall biosynthesis